MPGGAAPAASAAALTSPKGSSPAGPSTPPGLELMQKLKHAGFVSPSPSDGTPANPDDVGSGGTVLNALPRHLPGVAIYS